MSAGFVELLRRRHLPGLDGLRAIGILTVVVFHFDTTLLPGADIILSMFFVVSGFLITWLMRTELAETGSFALREFYWRRALRIIPAYYAFIAVTTAVVLLVGDWFRPVLWTSLLTFNMDYFVGLVRFPGWVGHAWTLGIEAKFYLLWPFLFAALVARGTRTLRLALVGVIVGVLLWRTYLMLSGTATGPRIAWTFDTRIDNIAIGCLLAAVADASWFTRAARAITRWSWTPLVTVGLIFLSRYVLSSPGEGGYSLDLYHETLGLTLEGFLWAALIVQLMVLADRPLWGWLNAGVLRHVSRMSYSMYLLHLLGLFVGQLAAPPSAPALRLLVGLLATYLLAAASYYAVERPFQRMRERARPVATAVPAAP